MAKKKSKSDGKEKKAKKKSKTKSEIATQTQALDIGDNRSHTSSDNGDKLHQYSSIHSVLKDYDGNDGDDGNRGNNGRRVNAQELDTSSKMVDNDEYEDEWESTLEPMSETIGKLKERTAENDRSKDSDSNTSSKTSGDRAEHSTDTAQRLRPALRNSFGFGSKRRTSISFSLDSGNSSNSKINTDRSMDDSESYMDLEDGNLLIDAWKKQKQKSRLKKEKSRADLRQALETFESKRITGEVVTYPPDCYSFLAIHSPTKKPLYFFFGLLVFLFQIMFLMLMVLSKTHPLLSSNGEVDNPSDDPIGSFIPSNVSILVRATQVTAVMSYVVFADSSLRDVVTAVEMFPRFDRATRQDHLWLVVLSCTLRFIQGLLAIFVTVLMVITTSEVVEIILNFTAISFISDLDENAFELAKWGKYGPSLENEAKSIEQRPIPYCLFRKNSHVRYRYTVIPIALLLMVVMSGIIYAQESNNTWVTKTLRVQFQDETGLQPYSGCYKLDKGVEHHNRWNYNGHSSNPESGLISYCNKRRQWMLFKKESAGDISDYRNPCDIAREYELAHSAKTDSFDVSSAFEGGWYSASGTPLDLYFFDSEDEGESLNENCDSFLNNGYCDVYFNTIGYQYDGGDCCAATCSQSDCGSSGITGAFGVENKTGNGYRNCADPSMVSLTIELNTISSSRDKNLLEVTDFQVEEYFREKGIDFWTEAPVTPFFIVDCDGYNALSIYVDDSMANKTETIMVRDGASCKVSVSNTTNFFKKWDNDPIWWVNYTVYHGNDTKHPIISGYSGAEESIQFQRIPICYFEKLSGSINISSAYTLTNPSTQSLNWLIDDDSAYSSCDNNFLIERFALGAVNFAAPINSASDDSSDSPLWISAATQQCRWENIACDEGSVETLAVRSKDLSGTIPTAIGLLTKLRRMDYDSNGLSSTIPSEIGLLTNLKGLDIDNNELTGTIPTEFGQLVNMIELDLDKNKLTGTIPTEFGLMINAREFDLIYNQLSGPIPSQIGKLKNIATLGFEGNQLSGTIPTEIGLMLNLEGLQVAGNKISGTIPSEIQLPRKTFKDFDVANNLMTGTIPTDIGKLTTLEKLQLNGNMFFGTIPSEIGLMTSLSYLNLQGNNFSGTIPTEIGLLSNLRELWLDGNSFTGTISRGIALLERLRILTLDDNISGSVPSRIKTLNPCDLCNGQNYEIRSELNNDKAAYHENGVYGGIESFSCPALLDIKHDAKELLSGEGCQFLRDSCVSCGGGNFRDIISLGTGAGSDDKDLDQLHGFR